jgi:hypothetical protein
VRFLLQLNLSIVFAMLASDSEETDAGKREADELPTVGT